MIHEGYQKDPGALWAWIFALLGLSLILWIGGNWYGSFLNTQQQEKPFLRVSNRDMSLFLWQHPEYLRVNAKTKSGYLPAFQYLERVSVEPALAEQIVIAPPDLLFRYHTWHRLVGDVWFPRAIPAAEFLTFIEDAEEWKPQNWAAGPQAYKEMVAKLTPQSVEDLQTLPDTTMPNSVRIAFQGWKNFRLEGEAINRFSPTYAQVNTFLEKYPHYARNYWQNLDENYLKTVAEHAANDQPHPKTDLVPFLRAALYNANR